MIAAVERPNAVGTMLDSVRPERITWLSRGRLAAGKITVLDSDPGLGKSTLTIDWCARVTRGEALPDGQPAKPRGVVMIAPEDGVADTILPRFMAAGADLSRVLVFDGVPIVGDPYGSLRLPMLPDDIEYIRRFIESVDAAVVVIDPLFAALSPAINANMDQDVRRALSPLARLADETGAAFLIVRHLNKMAGGPALYRGGGSIGITGAARFGLLMAADPRDPSVRVLATTKVNLGKRPDSLVFTLVEDLVNPDVAKVEYLGTSSQTADELLSARTADDPEDDNSKELEAAVWLAERLSRGKEPATQVAAAAEAAGISRRTLERARSRLQVVSRPVDRVWHVSLPDGPVRDPQVADALARRATSPTATISANIANQMGMAELANFPAPGGVSPLGKA